MISRRAVVRLAFYLSVCFGIFSIVWASAVFVGVPMIEADQQFRSMLIGSWTALVLRDLARV